MGNMKHTAQELRQMADQCETRRQESFERCDTDGFMSQAASQTMAQVYRAQAQIVENGGQHCFTGLYEGKRRVPARLIDGRYGTSWLVAEEADREKFGRTFIPFSGVDGNSRVQKALGLTECFEMAPAWAKCGGWGMVRFYRTGDQDGRDAVLCSEG